MFSVPINRRADRTGRIAATLAIRPIRRDASGVRSAPETASVTSVSSVVKAP